MNSTNVVEGKELVDAFTNAIPNMENAIWAVAAAAAAVLIALMVIKVVRRAFTKTT